MSDSYTHVFWIVFTLVLLAIILGIVYYYSDDNIEKTPAFIWLVFSPLMMISIFCLGQSNTEK